jgi:hypothetical protein
VGIIYGDQGASRGEKGEITFLKVRQCVSIHGEPMLLPVVAADWGITGDNKITFRICNFASGNGKR